MATPPLWTVQNRKLALRSWYRSQEFTKNDICSLQSISMRDVWKGEQYHRKG